MVISSRSKAKIYHRNWCPYAEKIGKEYRKEVSEQKLKKKGYKECTWCGGLHGIYLALKRSPSSYGVTTRNVQFFWDRKYKGLCIETGTGFWKVLVSWTTGKYALHHLNRSEYNRLRTVRQRIKGIYHRQDDVKQTDSICSILNYVVEHDKAKRIIEKDYRKLPKKTPRQKYYYKQVERKMRREERKRVDDLFEQIQNERKKGRDNNG